MATIETIHRFKFSIGGYGSTNYLFELEDNKATFCSYEYILEFTEKRTIDVSNNELVEFISKLNELDILKWHKRYDSDTLDGTQWKLELVYNNSKNKSIYGSNSYPDTNGHSYKPTKTFNKFLEAITKLIQLPSFFSR